MSTDCHKFCSLKYLQKTVYK